MNIVLFCGGTGSAAIQESIKTNNFNCNLSIITNGFDNGKSTGLVRQVFDGDILGPSDIRKNQLRQYIINNGDKDIYEALEHRFTCEKPREYVLNYIDLKITNGSICYFLKECVNRYFDNPNSANITYSDFSIGNIIYAQLAYENNNSMQAAADIIKKMLKIKADILVTDDKSLFLYAKTKNGVIIDDEAKIVDYNNSIDYIDDIFFKDSNNNEYEYSLINNRCIDAINDADIIIFSCGTQWSSLIPTYKSKTHDNVSFNDIIKNSKAKKYLIMNGKEDKDMINRGADDILDIVERYVDLKDFTILLPDVYDSILGKSTRANTEFVEIEESSGKHTYKIMNSILLSYYNKPTKNDVFCFDWDDTVVARKGQYHEISNENTLLLKNAGFCKLDTYIISGNNNFNIPLKKVYADAAMNYYENQKFKYHLNDKFNIPYYLIEKVKNELIDIGFNNSMFSDRNGMCFSIKPIESIYRKVVKSFLDNILINTDFCAHISGKTTIDIMHKEVNKMLAIDDIRKKHNNRIFYCGDEYVDGNDKIIFDNQNENLIFIKINSVHDTNNFIKILNGL